jgi:hypothetical protein
VALAVLALLAFRPRRNQLPSQAYPVPSGDDRVVVEVLNGTSRQGLARVGTRLLRTRGFDVVFFGNAETESARTRVIVRRGSGSGAGAVAGALGVGELSTEIDTLRRVDLTVILGEDFRPRGGFHP